MTDENRNENQDPEQLGDAGKRALDAERRARRDAEKNLREAREQIAEFERADIVREVASDKGLDPKFAARLKGTTKEELEADADELLEMVAPDERTKPGVTSKPRENLRGGGDPTQDVPEPVDKLAEKILDQ